MNPLQSAEPPVSARTPRRRATCWGLFAALAPFAGLACLLVSAAPTAAQCPPTWFTGSTSIGFTGIDNNVNALASLPNGDLIAGGDFASAEGVAVNRIVRITNPGSSTRTWLPIGSGTNGAVRALIALANGDVIVGGDFTSAGGVSASRIARVNPTTGVWSALGSGVDGAVRDLAILPDGDLVAVGDFSTAGGGLAFRIARYDFTTGVWSSMGSGANGVIRAVVALPSGDVVVGGGFGGVGSGAASIAVNNIARYNAGSNTWSPMGNGTAGEIYALTLLPGGDLIVGGNFTNAGNSSAPRVARLNPATGAWSAPAEGPGGTVHALHTMPDGSVIVGGNFTTGFQIPIANIVRLSPATWSWSSFGSSPVVGANGAVFALAPFAPGNTVFAGGAFTLVGSSTGVANRIARLNPGYAALVVTQPPVSQTVCAGTAATFSVGGISGGNLSYQWQRNTVNISGATSAVFTISNAQPVNAASYTCVVTSTCASGGSPTSLTTSAATLTVNGAITTQPVSQFATAGQSVDFTVAINNAPATYQWRRNGVNIPAASNPSATTATLTLPDVRFSDAAAFSCVITTPCGNVTSASATLRVNCPSAFSEPAFLTAGVNPFKAVTADLNGDGFIDAIVSNASSDTLSVFLGNGNGTFQPAVNYPTGGRPGEIAIADFNADGRPDVAVACFNTGCVVHFGEPNGTLSAPLFISALAQFTGIAAGDFNGDDRPDIVFTRGPLDRFFICVNNGDGTFGAPLQRSTAAGASPGPVVTGDFNRDGRTDLIIGTSLSGGSISVYTGNGDTTFTGSPLVIAAGGIPTSLAIADFDGNLFIDVVASIDSTGTAALFLGNGNATFQTRADYPVGATPNAIATGDFNGDGAPDIAVVNHLPSTVTIRLGNRSATNTFGPATAFPEGDRPFGLAVGDFNNDGRPDLFTANYWGNNVAVLLSTSSLPAFTQQPADLTTCLGQSAAFTVTVSSPSPVTYQWRKNGLAISGATTPSLQFFNLQAVNAGDFDCIVTNSCGVSICNPITLTITGVCACSVGDIVGIGGSPGPDGLLTGDDFNFFIAAFASGAALSDIVGIGGQPPSDGLITGDDFNAFISAFAAGCP